MGTVFDDRPPVLLELCENIMGTICIFFPGNMEITEMNGVEIERCVSESALVIYCESDALQVCQEIPGDDQGVSDEDLGDGDGDGGAHV
jgi:hypothetical protein